MAWAFPIFDTAIANLGERNFEYVAMPFTDTTSLLAWEIEYGFTDTGRWGWMRQLYGHIFSAKRADYASMIVFGETRNAGISLDHGLRAGIAVAGLRMGGGLYGEGCAGFDQRSGTTTADAVAAHYHGGSAA